MQEKQSDLLKFAIQLAKESAQILLKVQNKAKIVQYKGTGGDFALNADIASEQHVMKRIRQKYPNHDILTEETGHHHKDSDYLWIIDPLEGTLNYAHKLPLWAVNIGLYYKGQPYIGVVYAPILKEFFHAAKGKGAYLNGKRIRVNKETEVEKSFYEISPRTFEKTSISKHLLRRFGCNGLALAYLACGRFGAVQHKGPDPFGRGAGSIVIFEAGGKITDLQGKPWSLKSDGMLASNGKLHDKLLKLLGNTS